MSARKDAVLAESAPEWRDGVAANLRAAAEDAEMWLELIQRLHAAGRWKFSEPDSVKRLAGCREALRKQLGWGRNDP